MSDKKFVTSFPDDHFRFSSQNVTSWPSKTDDFFPYANSKHSYWTGFFTSRPTLKYMERYTNALLQVSKQVTKRIFDYCMTNSTTITLNTDCRDNKIMLKNWWTEKSASMFYVKNFLCKKRFGIFKTEVM